MAYEASIICVVFDNKGAYEDLLQIGIAHSPTEACSLLMEDIWRVMKDFGDGKGEIEESESIYGEPLTVVITNSKHAGINHWHYYCMVDERKSEAEATI